MVRVKRSGVTPSRMNLGFSGRQIWGAASGVGSNATQLCHHAGLRVVATCLPANFDYIRHLGADTVFNYRGKSVVEDVLAELDKTTCVGIFSAAGDTKAAIEIAHHSKQDLFIAASTLVPQDLPDGVRAKFIMGGGLDIIHRETMPKVVDGFLVEALERGIYKVAPPPQVLQNRGVKAIQEGIDIVRKGVSAKKIVVVNR
ncbi:hypothetical protein ANO11243_093170 [Dothideomycetidae sp. 11243]|nr:hypothetical protein ANO11243_093170 [fungal sp. No.11243]